MKIIDGSTIRFLFYLFWAIVVASAIFFPAQVNKSYAWIYEIGDLIADVRVNRKISAFPAALVFTYLMAVFLALALGVFSCLSAVIVKMAFLLRVRRGAVSSSFLFVMAIFLPFLLVFVEAKPPVGTSSDLFFSAMSKSRIVLMLWCSSVFLIFFGSISVFFASIVGIFISGENK